MLQIVRDQVMPIKNQATQPIVLGRICWCIWVHAEERTRAFFAILCVMNWPFLFLMFEEQQPEQLRRPQSYWPPPAEKGLFGLRCAVMSQKRLGFPRHHLEQRTRKKNVLEEINLENDVSIHPTPKIVTKQDDFFLCF